MQGHMGDIRQCSVAEMLGIQRRRHAGIMVGGHFSRWFRLGTTCDRDKRFSKMKETVLHGSHISFRFFLSVHKEGYLSSSFAFRQAQTNCQADIL